ncbi:N-acyl-D-amino-acid deacylase [Lentibacillus sp. JNUCC-1]|uniref:amidohydrolase n=1 Tax=Lentibacillus sp. JNUCC-1 TaxID=2654513 RepID=UPI0012E914A8|nr:amidohydrolase [Lentibacillus sp. JNUCC-1]MUV36789.1 N-acyl-D-amino-acid deacylase [Lentibacillus sp. JNUCC-1]
MTATWLLNVKLETGSYTDEDNYTYTSTDLFHLKIEDGKIVQQISAKEDLPEHTGETVDAKGNLAVPAFKEMHNHLDKTYMGVGWKAPIPVNNLKERLEMEARELKELAKTAEMRADLMIQTLLSYGSTHIRTHVNIDPYIGLDNLEGVLAALDKHKGAVTADVIAFPQHGLLNDEVPSLMKEAMRNGATMVGGLDPAGIDGAVEKSLHSTMDLAAEFDADVDIHIHDGGHVGWYTIEKWLDLVEDAGWKDRTAASHAFSLGDVPLPAQEKIASRMAKQGMDVMSTIPLTATLPPIQLLDSAGVGVHFGCDGFYDSWGPFGTGDVLEKATRFCEMSGMKDEASLRKALKWCTGGVTPLDGQGNKQWPNNGDAADFVFADVASSAELVARRPERKAVMKAGKIVSGSLT